MTQEKLNIAVFIDYDNIEIGVKSTLRREFNVSATLDALRERGDIVSKFAYSNWGLQPNATRQMAENAVQMVQRNPSPRGDKNAGDINLAIDALEMAFRHDHINAFAIVSGDSDFNPLVNKLKEYGKTVFVVGGKAFTSNILQQNCHEFISYETIIGSTRRAEPPKQSSGQSQRAKQQPKRKTKTLDIARVVPLIERTLQVLERRNVTPQLGLLKSTMLQLDSRFSERDYGASSFSELVQKLREAGYLQVSGQGGQTIIETHPAEEASEKLIAPEEALPVLRDLLETHRLEVEDGVTADELEGWFSDEAPSFDWENYGFQTLSELLNFAQDKLVVRIEPDEEEGLLVYLGEEFYPTADTEKKKAASEAKAAKKSTSRRRTASRTKRTRKKAATKKATTD
jgi:uncharacterized protein (TIGR00288 family)